MTKIVRYNGNLQAFASAAVGTERTLFGEVTQADDLTSQVTADFLRGWGIVGPSDQPALEDFNGAMYTHGQLLAYLHQVGIPEYNATQEYHLNSYVNSGGALYVSLANSNTGNTPASSPASWSAYGKGRLANHQFLTATGTVTKTAGSTKWRVRQWGGGGQGGGTQATTSGQVAAGGGGSAGSYAEAWFDVAALVTASLTIGPGGSAGAVGAAGAAGGTTTLTMGANSLTCPGGPGGGLGLATNSPPNEGGAAGVYSTAPSHVGALSFVGTQGGGATTGITLSMASAQPGIGGSSSMGYSRAGSTPSSGTGYGSGGCGQRSLISTGANNGPSGAQGLTIIEEYF